MRLISGAPAGLLIVVSPLFEVQMVLMLPLFPPEILHSVCKTRLLTSAYPPFFLDLYLFSPVPLEQALEVPSGRCKVRFRNSFFPPSPA